MTPVAATCQVVSNSPWANVAIGSTVLGALVFVATYAWTTRGAWRDTAVGMNVMAFMTVVLIVSALAAVGIVWGTNWPHREVIRTAAWGLIAGVIWWRVYLLWLVQHCTDDHEPSDSEGSSV